MPKRMKDLSVVKVDLVDRPANKRRFLVIKRANRGQLSMPTSLIENSTLEKSVADEKSTIDLVNPEFTKISDSLANIKSSIGLLLKDCKVPETVTVTPDDFAQLGSSLESLASQIESFGSLIEAALKNLSDAEGSGKVSVSPEPIHVSVDLSQLATTIQAALTASSKKLDETVESLTKRLDKIEKSVPGSRSLDGQDDPSKSNDSVFRNVFRITA